MEYPTDVTLGPVNEPDLSAIFKLLTDQNKKFEKLQEQVNTIANGSTVNNQQRTPANHGTGTAPNGSGSASNAPNMLSRAAENLNSQLSNLGENANNGFGNITMQQLRGIGAISKDAEQLLSQVLKDVPALQDGDDGSIPGTPSRNSPGMNNVSTTVDQLYAATMRNKQLKAFEFAATGQFSYSRQLRQDNLNAVTFAFGSFKHLEAAMEGLISMSKTEFLARLRHLKNTFEIACLSSNLNNFTDQSWLVAREYDTRVIADIESGAKTWASLSRGLETDAIYCANRIVENREKSKKKEKPKAEKNNGEKSESKSKPCTTFNSHRNSDGCLWEQNNQGKTCVFRHFCSWCKENRNVEENHKLFNCEHKSE